MMTQYDILVVFVVLLLIGSVIFLMACQNPVKKTKAKKATASKKKTSVKAKKPASKAKKSTAKRKK